MLDDNVELSALPLVHGHSEVPVPGAVPVQEEHPPAPAEFSVSMPVDIDLSVTFMEMMFRKIERKRTGTYKKSKTGRFISSFILVGMLLALIGAFSANSDGNAAGGWQTVSYVVISAPILYIAQSRISAVWSVVFFIILLDVVILAFAAVALKPPEGSVIHVEKYKEISEYVTASLILISFILIGLWILYYLMYPKAIRAGKMPPKKWQLHPVEGSPGEFIYVGLDPAKWWNRDRAHVCKYVGDIDQAGRPHGFGEWTDNSLTGECLSGNVFAALRIGIVRSAADPWDSTYFVPRARSGPLLEYGVATVECSISGKFFSRLPHADLLTPLQEKEAADGVRWVLANLTVLRTGPGPRRSPTGVLPHPSKLENTLPDRVTVWVDDEGSFVVDDHVPMAAESPGPEGHAGGPQRPDELRMQLVTAAGTGDVGLRVAGWNFRAQEDSPLGSIPRAVPTFQRHHRTEVLVMIPGFNSTAQSASQSLGQLLSLGSFPTHLKPFIFNWSGGGPLSFHYAQKMAESDVVANHLMAFLGGLQDAGIERVHLMGHSMGARVLLSAVNRFEAIFRPLAGAADPDYTTRPSPTASSAASPSKRHPGLILGSFILLNAEADHPYFVRTAFPRIHAVCRAVTLYSDDQDGALLFAKWFGDRADPLGRCGHLMYELPTLPTDAAEVAKKTHHQMHLRGRMYRSPYRRQWLDLDVVDTTTLQVNVHNLRHSYFNLNRLLVDDLLDLIVTGRRAHARRHRLIRSEGNRFAFLTAPSYVVA
ncbi:hypothetical protein BDK51DRAFT_47769 [Blyttiomyces helicus]|uniref:Alpha/Beta hydrolase protein n=1 Tax=Blyttiomyces helicus TaxID=388810 RepID=A0A4V1IRY5_9FUNG|nr:hypothetical protein BDK51DRAFT_47769 [Blyttiomyces helicus]|eukprot:RKO91677.1 hypothetical protein BDK51DRAFT_47769 [Blyttiomyces helicus]